MRLQARAIAAETGFTERNSLIAPKITR